MPGSIIYVDGSTGGVTKSEIKLVNATEIIGCYHDRI